MSTNTKERKQELRDKVEKAIMEYNEAMLDGKFAKVADLDDEIKQWVNEYTALARKECFAECEASDNPMIEAVKRLSFETIGVKDEKTEMSKIPVRTLIERTRAIDLLKLHKFIKGGIGADKNWAFIAEKLNFLMTAQVAIDIGANPKSVSDSYAMSDIARQIDMGKTPCSKTNMLKTLQTIVTAMIGDGYKATSHDVNFLLRIYSRKGRRALTVACANHNHFRTYLAEICNHIITGNAYNTEHPVQK